MIGQTVSHYRILEKLGSGGMGEVFLAEDTELQRRVALKFLPRHFSVDANVRARFKREAQALAALNHPNIVTVFQVAEHQGQPFIAMEYVEGQPLKQLVASGDLGLERILDLAIQTAEGLASAHKAQIVHRDIKSDNILISAEGRAKIMDFGVATLRGTTRLTQEGSTVGTLAYMSPEQAQGKEVDARSDLFSLGVILYELCTGRLPFRADHDAALLYAVVHEEPEPLTRYTTKTTEPWQRMVSKCLAKSLEERYQSAPDLLADLKSLKRHMASERPSAQATASAADKKPSIAVLPLANMSADPENEYFADGLSEELLNLLARNPQLKVTAMTSSFAFKGKQVDLREIGQKLGVGTILEGSVRKAGNRVRITAQLINVSDGFHLWSDTYDRVLDDVFAVQDDIAKAVAGALKVALLGARVSHYVHHPEAYRLYLQSRHFLLRHTRQDVETAVRLLKQAVELDPGDALIWAGLSWAYQTQEGYGTAELEKGYLTAKEAAARALELDDECVEGHRAIGVIKFIFEFDWLGSQHHLEKALSVEPSNARCLSSLAYLFLCSGRLDQALSLFERSIEIDPLAPGAYNNLGIARSSAGRSEEAVDAFLKVLELSPAFLGGRTRLGIQYLDLGQPLTALATIEQETEGGYRDYGLAIVYHAVGRSAESDAAYQSLRNRGEQWAYQLAIVSTYRGDREAGFHWLERAREAHDSGLTTVAVTPLLSDLHSDPRWPVFLRKLGVQS